MHRARRVPRFLAKDSLWSVPVLGQALRGTGQIPVFRGTADAKAQPPRGQRALADGQGRLIVYPEGTISRDPDQWPMHSRTGVARLALTSDVPVVPMVHWGTHERLDGYRSGSARCRASTVIIRCGEPVDLSAYRGRDDRRARCCARSPT